MRITRSQICLVLGVEALFLIMLAGWVLLQLDRLLEPTALSIAIAILVAGEIASALVMQRLARAQITLSPGEHGELLGQVISGFDGHRKGRVFVRGERWDAETEKPDRVAPGDQVRITARAGLTLRVEPTD